MLQKLLPGLPLPKLRSFVNSLKSYLNLVKLVGWAASVSPKMLLHYYGSGSMSSMLIIELDERK